MTHPELYQAIAETAHIKDKEAEALVDAVFEEIGRALTDGEEAELEGFGSFFNVKYPAETVEDPPGSGNMVINLPEVVAEFEPDDVLVGYVTKQMQRHPELFASESDEDETSAKKTLPDLPASGGSVVEAASGGSLASEAVASIAASRPRPEASKGEDGEISKDKPLSRASQIEFLDISNMTFDKQVLALVPVHVAKQYDLIPVDVAEGILTVAMINPEDFDALQVVSKETGLAVKAVLTTREDLNTALDQYTGLQAELQEVIESSDLGISKKDLEGMSAEDLQDQTNENAPTAKIVYSLLRRAVKERASDVHIEPYENKLRIRFRLDGVLQVRVDLPKEIQSAVISRLKILANLKIDEQRLPQDGRFNLIIDHKPVDFRLSTIPVVFGEKVVMRILDKSVGIISLEEVGLSDHGLEVLNKNMERSHGMILVTGPTGSGKTTSLYAVLGKMMSETVNILTLEDPVEYRIESINQSQVHSDIGYSFASGLRAAVRQDPDIVMLGEIRDQETADMAIHAALTGHIVLSTLHTNDAAGAFPRLIDMHIEPFLITSSVHTVIAQRLARKVCQECKEELKIDDGEIKEIEAIIKQMPEHIQKEIGKEKLTFYHGKGCDVCGGKGYKGRLGVFEVLDVSEPSRALILKRSSGDEITRQAISEGMVTMVQDGIVKALRGLTTMSEVWRVTKE